LFRARWATGFADAASGVRRANCASASRSTRDRRLPIVLSDKISEIAVAADQIDSLIQGIGIGRCEHQSKWHFEPNR
jgi:hypothetical protein